MICGMSVTFTSISDAGIACMVMSKLVEHECKPTIEWVGKPQGYHMYAELLEMTANNFKKVSLESLLKTLQWPANLWVLFDLTALPCLVKQGTCKLHL